MSSIVAAMASSLSSRRRRRRQGSRSGNGMANWLPSMVRGGRRAQSAAAAGVAAAVALAAPAVGGRSVVAAACPGKPVRRCGPRDAAVLDKHGQWARMPWSQQATAAQDAHWAAAAARWPLAAPAAAVPPWSASWLLRPRRSRAAASTTTALGALTVLRGDPVYDFGFLAALAVVVVLASLARPWEPATDEGQKRRRQQRQPSPPAEVVPSGSEEETRDGPSTGAAEDDEELSSLAWVFLPAWYLCVAGDWLQGPYVYALYESYGLPRTDIARLFVAGFGASMAVGTTVGSWVDRLGRKRGCQLYCILYMLSCCSKHFSNFWVLMLGRLSSGVATSLLFSAFESWLVREHELRQASSASAMSLSRRRPKVAAGLGRLFVLMWFGSSIVAILAGPAGDAVVGLLPLTRLSEAATGALTPVLHVGGFTAAFDLAAMLLLTGLLLISFTWRENRGEEHSEGLASGGNSPVALLTRGVKTISSESALVGLMAIVAGFEGAMYSFVFNWTPSLTEGASSPPVLGGVFATLMLAYTAGSLIFQLLGVPRKGKPSAVDPLVLLRGVLLVAPVALLISASGLVFLPPGSYERTARVLGGFTAFELCCGLYAPTMSAVKGRLVPEHLRSTIYNTYRVPMNGVVLAVLLSDLSPATALCIAAGLLVVAAGASTLLPQALGSDRASTPELDD